MFGGTTCTETCAPPKLILFGFLAFWGQSAGENDVFDRPCADTFGQTKHVLAGFGAPIRPPPACGGNQRARRQEWS